MDGSRLSETIDFGEQLLFYFFFFLTESHHDCARRQWCLEGEEVGLAARGGGDSSGRTVEQEGLTFRIGNLLGICISRS